MGASSLFQSAQNIGKYTLIEKIGEGYLGPVYRGFDQDLGTPVAVRILCDGIKWDSKLEEAFDRESRAISGLRHPNIASVLDIVTEGNSRCVVMESLGSGTLQNLIAKNSGIPVETKLSLMIQISEGLSYAHKNGVLHRDLVPGKIHLTPDANAKMRDFAIANVLMKHLPHPVVRWGTPIYLSPEQIQKKECDARSDIFSAGTIFYELLTHCHPFHDRDSNKALDNILSDSQIPTFEKFPDVPPGIWTILRSCLAKNPEDRYGNADELSQACRKVLVSMAEDTQLVLSELYAALPPLRKAASQPNASAGIRWLLNEIQSLLRGERQGEYSYLDRLMTELMEQYPAIQMAASAPPSLDSICPQLPREEAISTIASETEFLAPPSVPKTDHEAGPSLSMPGLQGGIALDPQSSSGPTEIPDNPEQSTEAGGKKPLPKFIMSERESTTAPAEIENEEGTEPAALPENSSPAALALPVSDLVQTSVPVEVGGTRGQSPTSIYRRMRRPSYRSAAMLLAVLVIATAGYIFLGSEAATPIRKALDRYIPFPSGLLRSIIPASWNRSGSKGTVAADVEHPEEKISQKPVEVLLNEALALAAGNRFEESRIILQRILEIDPEYQPAVEALRKIEAVSKKSDRPPQESISRISALLNSGKLQSAKTEIDSLGQIYPDATEIITLRKRWRALSSKQVQEDKRNEEEQQKAIVRQREDDWNRQLTDFFARGKYGEAAGALSLWLTENPGSSRAQELNARIQEIQRHLKTYSTAIAENRYPDALNALSSVEKLNPSDPHVAELRRQAEDRRASAKAILTVHRLGPKANLLLDGRPIGKDGELENEPISIGSHTLAIENGGGLIASKIQDYGEGQRVILVYDMVKQYLRPMTDADREALAQRRAIEEVQRFTLEHDHGLFRGSCRGILSLNSLDVAYSPFSGAHGFRIPFKLLKLKTDDRTVSLYYISDNSHFQTFRFQDSQTVEKFRQKWDELKAILR